MPASASVPNLPTKNVSIKPAADCASMMSTGTAESQQGRYDRRFEQLPGARIPLLPPRGRTHRLRSAAASRSSDWSMRSCSAST
jgi:hypothetical protein